MKEEAVKRAIQDFAKSNDREYEKIFSISGNSDELFTIRIERRKTILVTESFKSESRANTISALPSGAPCSYCGGSGRAG